MATKADLIELISENDTDTLSKLLGGIKPSRLEFLYKWASSNGYDKSVELFLSDERLDPALDDDFAIRLASSNGHPNVVRLLLANNKVNPGALFDYALRTATENNHIEIVKLLLNDSRVDLMNAENEAVITAIRKNYLDILKKFIEKLEPKLSTNPVLYEMMLTASSHGHLNIIKELYSFFPPDQKLYLQFNQILSASVEYGYIDIVTFLLEDFRADPNYNKEEMLNIARCKKYMNILNLLYKAQEKNRILGNSKTTLQQKANRLMTDGFISIDKATIKFDLNGTRRKLTLEFEL
jgi:ankyrin repeat protein